MTRQRTTLRRGGILAITVVAGLALAGCTTGAEPAPTASGFTTEKAIEYRNVDGTSLKADACIPSTGVPAEGAPALVMLHGGGFTEGSRSEGGMPELCAYYAERGYASFSIDYRLLPENRFPTQLEDASAAVEWLREPEQVERFGIDPTRIGAMGSSAGAIVSASLGTQGEGPLTEGSRVKTVVAFSAVADMSASGMELGDPIPEAEQQILAYLGCTEVDDETCPQGIIASPITAVDPTDAPQIWLSSEGELVPVEQAEEMQSVLEAAGVPVELGIEGEAHHGLQNNTPNNKRAILAFLQTHL